MSRLRLGLVIAIAASAGCPSIDNDGNEVGTGPVVEFDPGNSVVPFPNNLLLNPATRTLNLPEQCNESPAQTFLRENTLNKLDGFGTFKAGIRFTLSEPLDPDTDLATLRANIKVFKRATGTTPVDPANATEVPILIIPGTTLRYDAACTAPSPVDAVTIVPFITDATTGAPLAPIALEEQSTYVVMVGTGLHADDMAAGSTGGPAFGPSFTWAFVRQTDDPVTVDPQTGTVIADRTPLDPSVAEDAATLLGVDLLWKAHKQALDFVTAAADVTREEIVLAWEFTTQTTTKQLDPTAAGSPAAAITATPLLGMGSVTGAQTPDEYLRDPTRIGNAGCDLIGCASIGAILGGLVVAPQYQVELPNPAGFAPIPGEWNDPKAPTAVADEQIQVVAFLPQGSPPAAGWPTIVFGHGLGSAKETAAAIAPQLARAGFATIAIDFVAHGSRAKRISDADNAVPQLSCAGTPNPTQKPQCFQPIFSANLGQTRDNIRQTVLDLQQLTASARTCTPAAPCGLFAADPDNVGYLGISLGGIIGSMVTAESEGLEAGVTNVAGGGLLDIIENTQTLQIKCLLVNALIDAGVVVGDKWDPTNPTVGACLTDEWKTQPGYVQFAAIARWVLDPADPANFAAKLATRVTLLQEVMGDKVVPNIATDQLGVLSARTPVPADPAVSPTPPPTAAVDGATSSLWVRYTNLPADAATGFPGNSFHHASLLRPNEDGAVPPTAAEVLGYFRVRVDATEFLTTNVIDN
jgi:dienelactone hydrolase